MYSIFLLIVIGLLHFHYVVHANQYFSDKVHLRIYLMISREIIGSPPRIVYSSYPLEWVSIFIQYLDGTIDTFYLENLRPTSSYTSYGYGYKCALNISVYPDRIFNMKIFYKCYDRTFSIELRNICFMERDY